MYAKQRGKSFQGCCNYFKPKKELPVQEKSVLRLNVTESQTIFLNIQPAFPPLCTNSWRLWFLMFRTIQLLIKRQCFSKDILWHYHQTPLLCSVKPESDAGHQACPAEPPSPPAGWESTDEVIRCVCPHRAPQVSFLSSAEHGGHPKIKAQELLTGFHSFTSLAL